LLLTPDLADEEVIAGPGIVRDYDYSVMCGIISRRIFLD